MRFLTSRDCSRTSKPAMLAFPAVGGRKQVRTRIVVVFPAPFLPRKPTISPLPTSKEMFLTATLRAYRLVRPSTLIIEVLVTVLLTNKLRESNGIGRNPETLSGNHHTRVGRAVGGLVLVMC